MRVARLNRVLGYGPRGAARRREAVSLRWVRFVTRRPLAVLLVGLSLLGVAAVPALHMELGLPDGGSSPTTTTERRAYDILTDAFGPGFNGQLTVVVDAPGRLGPEAREQFAKDVARGSRGVPGRGGGLPARRQPEGGDLTIFAVTPEGQPVLGRRRAISWRRCVTRPTRSRRVPASRAW